MKYTYHIALCLVAVVVPLLLGSCVKNFDDDINELYNRTDSICKRVGNVEGDYSAMNYQLSQISLLANAVEQGFYITAVKTTADGYELTFNSGHKIVLQTTPDGTLTAMPTISMTQINGLFYWTMNGMLLTGTDGTPIRATGQAPRVKFDYTLNQWVISIDGGMTFSDINTYVSIYLNDQVLMEVINSYVSQHHTTLFNQTMLYQIVSTYIQQNYQELFNFDILNEVVTTYVNERYTRIFSYELLEKIFTQYDYEYVTSNIRVDELVSVIISFIKEHNEIFENNEVLYEIVSTYLEVNKTTIFSEEILLDVINTFIDEHQNYIDIDLLTQVVTNYIDVHRDVVFNTETVRKMLLEYVQKYYVQVFSQDILIRMLTSYVTQNSSTIFNEELITEIINTYVQNNYTTIFPYENIVDIVNDYIKTNATTLFNRDVLFDVISNYFTKNYDVFIDRTAFMNAINDYIATHHIDIIDVDVIRNIVYNYLSSYYREVFSYDMLTQVVHNYFVNHKEVIATYVQQGNDIIKQVIVDNDLCVITLSNGQVIRLVVYDAMARLRDRVQSIVVMPNAKGHVTAVTDTDNPGGYLTLNYLVTPHSMAQVIADKIGSKDITMRLMLSNGNGNVSPIAVSNVSAQSTGILTLNAQLPNSSDNKGRAVALHVKENAIAGTDIMTEFTLVDNSEFDDRITQEIPEEYLKKMKPYMPIYSGNTPPELEGTFRLSKDILVYDSSPNAYEPGHVFIDYIADFTHQDMKKNTILFRNEYRNSSGVSTYSEWEEAIVLGKNNSFTVFIILNNKHADGVTTSKMATILSGTKTDSGINNFYWGFVVLDKYDPNNQVMAVGDFRIFKDQDGYSEPTTWMARQQAARALESIVGPTLPCSTYGK